MYKRVMKYIKLYESYSNYVINKYTGDDIFYHGSREKFDKFKQVTKAGVELEPTIQPIFIAENLGEAQGHATSAGYVYLVKMLAKAKLFDYRSVYTESFEYTDEAQKLVDDIDAGVLGEFSGKLTCKDSNGNRVNKSGDEIMYEYIKRGAWDVLESKAFKNWFVNNGYDGWYICGEFYGTKYRNLAIMNLDILDITAVYEQKETYKFTVNKYRGGFIQ
jgi:hypothetical protein